MKRRWPAFLLLGLLSLGCTDDTRSSSDPDGGGEDNGLLPCGEQGPLEECPETTPSGSDAAAIAAFAQENALPLYCNDDSAADPVTPSYEIFLREFEERRVFMFGEVHGALEIMETAPDLMAALVEGGAVDTVALEIQMDVNEHLETYLSTGGGPLLDTYHFDSWIQNSFTGLVDRSRSLRTKGHTVTTVGIDVPMNLAWVHDGITAIGDTMPACAARDTVLDGLPEKVPFNVYDTTVSSAYADETTTYYDSVVAIEADICAVLSAGSCEELLFMVSALDLGAEKCSGTNTGSDYFDRREELIVYNYRRIFTQNPQANVYAHMGLYHTAKDGDTTANSIGELFPENDDPVYSVVAAHGEDSSVNYSGTIYDLEPSEDGLWNTLEDAPYDRYFLQANAPGSNCTESPFLNVPFSIAYTSVDTTYGDAFDGFIWFDRLNPIP